MRGALLGLAALSISALAEDSLVSRRLDVTSRLGRRGLATSEAFDITIVFVQNLLFQLPKS